MWSNQFDWLGAVLVLGWGHCRGMSGIAFSWDLGLITIKYSTQQLLSVWDSVGTHYNSLLANIGSHRQPRSQSTSRPNMVATQRDYEQAEVQRKLWNLLPMLPIFIVPKVPKYSKCWRRSRILWQVNTALGLDHRTLCEKMTARWINAWAAL